METDYLQIKRKILTILQRNGIARAGLFGSIVRGEATENSDIDILVEFSGKKSLLDLARLKITLEESLGRQVDIITYNSINPLLKDRILQEQEVLI